MHPGNFYIYSIIAPYDCQFKYILKEQFMEDRHRPQWARGRGGYSTLLGRAIHRFRIFRLDECYFLKPGTMEGGKYFRRFHPRLRFFLGYRSMYVVTVGTSIGGTPIATSPSRSASSRAVTTVPMSTVSRRHEPLPPPQTPRRRRFSFFCFPTYDATFKGNPREMNS